MKLLIALCSLLLVTNTATSFNTIDNPDTTPAKCTELNLEECTLLHSFLAVAHKEPVEIEDIYVEDIEEEVIINFDTAKYLPVNFNPLKGKHDLDWNTIELIELEEEVHIDFDTNLYLPVNFNPHQGMKICEFL